MRMGQGRGRGRRDWELRVTWMGRRGRRSGDSGRGARTSAIPRDRCRVLNHHEREDDGGAATQAPPPLRPTTTSTPPRFPWLRFRLATQSTVILLGPAGATTHMTLARLSGFFLWLAASPTRPRLPACARLLRLGLLLARAGSRFFPRTRVISSFFCFCSARWSAACNGLLGWDRCMSCRAARGERRCEPKP